MNNERKCPNCHAQNSDGGICKLCGQDFNKPDNASNYLNNAFVSFNKASNIILIILLITAFAAVFAGYFIEMSESTEKILTMIPLFIMEIALLWIGILASKLGLKMKNLYTNGEKIEGEIVDYNQAKRSKLFTSVQIPIIEYTISSVKYRVVSNIGINKSSKIGDKVVIKFNSEKPHNALPLDLSAKYKTIISCSAVIFIIAIIFVVVGCL